MDIAMWILLGAAILVLDAVVMVIIITTLRKRKAEKQKRDELDDNIKIPMEAQHDQALQFYIEQGQMLHAIEAYQTLTNADPIQARQAVFYMARQMQNKGRIAVDTGGAGIHDLIAEGRIDDAIDAYRVYMGVDQYTAQDAVHAMREEISNSHNS